MRPKDQKLDYDSVSDITDLSKDPEDILTGSKYLLSIEERQRLSRYMSQLRQLQGYTAPKHNCLDRKAHEL